MSTTTDSTTAFRAWLREHEEDETATGAIARMLASLGTIDDPGNPHVRAAFREALAEFESYHHEDGHDLVMCDNCGEKSECMGDGERCPECLDRLYCCPDGDA
jgi:hypothetical protein